jgi:hypothetical protein
MFGDGGVMQASYGASCGPGGPGGGMGGYPMGPPTSQIAFAGTEGIAITWDMGSYGAFDSVPLITPGRQDFAQATIYRLRLSNLPGRPGVELYPTLEVAPVTPRTDAYLAHSPVPIQFNEEDLDQALSGNFVTKVVYLPDPEFQELALAGVETLVSTRLDPGVDPIAEADRRGSILAIVRMGNKDFGAGPAGMGGEPNSIFPAGYESDEEGYVDQVQYYAPGGGNPSGLPLGMPTAGFAPAPVPPNMVAGMGPQYGMPMSGTPIGLPGPPHIPLGSPAGLQRHIMKNRTRSVMPPPTPEVNITVKQRPGMNYPKPVNHVAIDETHREPFLGHGPGSFWANLGRILHPGKH